MGVVDFSALDRQRTEQRLRDGLAKDPGYLERQLKREIRRTERARLRGMWTPTPPRAPEPESAPEEDSS